jgi:DNA-binding MarR family transcriptional regulator
MVGHKAFEILHLLYYGEQPSGLFVDQLIEDFNDNKQNVHMLLKRMVEKELIEKRAREGQSSIYRMTETGLREYQKVLSFYRALV